MPPEPLQAKQLHHVHPWLSQGQTQVLQGSLMSKTPVDNPHAEVEINHNWNPEAVCLRKKTQNLPTSCTSWRLNPHDRLGRLCIYGIYKRTLRAPTKESTLIQIAVDIGGKNTLEQDRFRIWAAPIAGPEISTVLEDILGRWDGLWLPAVTVLTQEKHLLFLGFDLFYRVFWNFFFFFLSPCPPTNVAVNFLGTMKSN